MLSQIRQIDYLMSKSRDIKIKSRAGFEEDYEDIKTLLSAKTVFQVDDGIDELETIMRKVVERREELRALAPNTRGEAESSIDLSIRRENILCELLDTEERYVADIHSILVGYRDKMINHNSSISLKTETIFGNLDEIETFHSNCLLPELERCGLNSQEVARTFLEFSDTINRLYCRYCQNMEAARNAVTEVGENNALLMTCQKELGHQLPLSAYLLKPVQRLTKYQLLLKDLSDSSYPSGKFELDECVDVVLGMIKAVNDSLHQIDIKGLPEILHPLGSLVCQETFAVLTENKSQSQILFRNRQQRRHVLLYENHIVFCKQSGSDYHFKFSLATSTLGMSSIIKNEEKKMELWLTGQADIYTLEAKSKKQKEDFAAELRKVIVEQKEKESSSRRSLHPAMFTETMSTTSGSESLRSRRSHLSRSKSLDQGGGRRHRSRSLDPYQDRSSSEELIDNQAPTFPRYQVLADYMALTGRELNLEEGETVELIKIGCSGWWFVRLSSSPYSEGWAPSTYLEKLPQRNRTLDRK
ncbi:guanine nucleotide exchange factor DBS [Eurytemora carolleeae]|uniref:guanine nucleotide exchange factor DBS n=1 Tax=Eurytemora carolleeae TaxID=1294199 RepID=UPI000C786142|nr:guanine nucleotide exchange factor DBS [Eurytemora carolleeae]|eukprot:XP_023327389.1 guanine nucleotide exchange factor DBS-like [Eurytemora affinis]